MNTDSQISNNDNLKVSLVLCTINRTKELDSFFLSLSKQQYRNFECIVVDQNIDDRLLPIIQHYSKQFKLIYVKSNKRGLSINRNVGLSHISGEIICFPDDDCEYLPETLHDTVNFFMCNYKIQIYSCAVTDKLIDKRFNMPEINCSLNRRNFFDKTISIGIFIKYKNILDVSFDNKLGVGAEFGSAEESDLVASLLYKGYKGYYFGKRVVHHPFPQCVASKERYKNYSLGYGAFMKKELLLRKNIYFMIVFSIDLVKRTIASLLPLEKREMYYISLLNRLKGFYNYKL